VITQILNSKLKTGSDFLDINEVLHLVDLAPKLGVVGVLYGLVKAMQAEGAHGGALVLGVAYDALHPRYTEGCALLRYFAEIRLCHVRLLVCPGCRHGCRGLRVRHGHGYHRLGRHACHALHAEGAQASRRSVS
jgi:hypothetical protein